MSFRNASLFLFFLLFFLFFHYNIFYLQFQSNVQNPGTSHRLRMCFTERSIHMAKKGENIYRRKDNRWEGRYLKGTNEHGRQCLGYVYGRTYHEVKEKLDAAKSAADTLSDAADRLLFSYICTQWLQKERSTIKPSTYARYAALLENHVLSDLGGLPVTSLTPEFLNRFLLAKLEYGRKDGNGGLSPKTVQDIYTVIKSVIRYAEVKYCLKLPDSRPYPFPKTEKTITVLSPQNRNRLEEAMQMDLADGRRTGILLCLYCGLRIGEICALRWSDIDLDSGILRVSRTLQRIENQENDSSVKTTVIESTPKTHASSRDIPIPANILELLQKLRPDGLTDAYFLTGLSDHYIEPRNYQYFFRRTLEDLGIPPVNFHCLRHTFATRCIEVGFDVKTLSEILGHADINITLNHYVHSTLDMKKRQMDLLLPQV